MWDLPTAGIESTSPALAGELSTTREVLGGFAIHVAHPLLLRQQASWSLFFWWQSQQRETPTCKHCNQCLCLSADSPLAKESHMANPSVDRRTLHPRWSHSKCVNGERSEESGPIIPPCTNVHHGTQENDKGFLQPLAASSVAKVLQGIPASPGKLLKVKQLTGSLWPENQVTTLLNPSQLLVGEGSPGGQVRREKSAEV